MPVWTEWTAWFIGGFVLIVIGGFIGAAIDNGIKKRNRRD